MKRKDSFYDFTEEEMNRRIEAEGIELAMVDKKMQLASNCIAVRLSNGLIKSFNVPARM